MKRNGSKIIILVALIVCLLAQSSWVSAEYQLSDDWQSKIQPELWETMEQSDSDELIPTYIFLYDEPVMEMVKEQMPIRTGMDPEIYENDEKFNAQIVPEITRQVVEKYGAERAYQTETRTIPNAELKQSVFQYSSVAQSGQDYTYQTDSLVKTAVKKKVAEYNKAWQKTTAEVFTEKNNQFLEGKSGYSSVEPSYIGAYTGLIHWELPKESIIQMAHHHQVEKIGLYVEMNATDAHMEDQLPLTDIPWVKFNYYSGSPEYDVGILESSQSPGRPNVSHPELVGTQFVMRGNAPSTISDHATFVAQCLTAVVPNARVYYTQVGLFQSFANSIDILVGSGCKIINLSLGSDDSLKYSSYDETVDRVSQNSGVLFVIAAGNNIDQISSPAYAFCGVTVANYDQRRAIPGISQSSSYLAAYKPDIAAPGHFRFRNADGSFTPDEGTSFAAPIVTGVAEMIMEAGDTASKTTPTYVKSVLLCAANFDAIPASVKENEFTVGGGSTYTANSVASDQDYLRERSGAGMVNAYNAISIAHTNNYGTKGTTKSVYLQAGQTIRMASAVELIDKVHGFYRLEIWKGNYYAARKNKHAQNIFEYTAPETGYYSIRLLDESNSSNDGSFCYWVS